MFETSRRSWHEVQTVACATHGGFERLTDDPRCRCGQRFPGGGSTSYTLPRGTIVIPFVVEALQSTLVNETTAAATLRRASRAFFEFVLNTANALPGKLHREVQRSRMRSAQARPRTHVCGRPEPGPPAMHVGSCVVRDGAQHGRLTTWNAMSARPTRD
jgi:hypothetical protein